MVEEPVNLRIVDQDALNAEFKKIKDRLEREQREIEKKAKEIDDTIARTGQAPGDIGFGGGQTGKALPKGRDEQIARGKLASGQAPVIRSRPFQELRAQVEKNTETVDNFDSALNNLETQVGEFSALTGNPQAFFQGLVTRRFGSVLGFLKVAGIIGTIIATTERLVRQAIDTSFAPGGIFDIRKRVLDEANTIPDVDNLLAIQRGEVFFTSDTRVRQRVVQFSNTETLDLQSQRYNELILGSDLDVG